MSFCVSNKQIIVFCFPPNTGLLQQSFWSFCSIFCKGTTYFEWINDMYEFTLYDIGFAYLSIKAGCSSIVLFVCGICGLGTTNGIRHYMWMQSLVEFIFWCDNWVQLLYQFSYFFVIFMNSYIIWIRLNASTDQFVHSIYSDIPVMSSYI